MEKTNKKVLEILAEHLGTEADDILKEDSFSGDLRMKSVELTDFAQELENLGYAITPDNISDFETVGELLDYLTQEELL
jgi:acyl carrier protein